MQLTQTIISYFLLVSFSSLAAPIHSTSDIVSTIKGIHKKIDGIGKEDSSEESSMENDANEHQRPPADWMQEMSMRQNKMFGFYGYIPAFAPIPSYYPTLPSPDYYSDYNNYYGYNEDDDDAMSRGAGTKKRPNQFKNSPIYYIRLPPTPYMFVPGVGYISQPPTYQPMAPPPVVPVVPAMPTSPFYNLPLNFMANGKPTNVYQWQGQQQPQGQYGMQMPGQFGNQYQPTYNPQQMPQMPQIPQQQQQPPAQRPHKPYRPYRPQNNYMNMQDSKVTHLKGPYLFNGRPEEIYLLPNYQNLQNPYNAPYYPDPYSYNNYNPYNSYY